jgi:3-hydroxyisobutyrate dehydrogenase-like beta-hydroxyacid dehydrogenase
VTVVGFVGFGEVASRFAAAMDRQGAEVAAYDVVLDHAGGADRLKQRAGDTAVTFVTLAELITRSDLVLSAVTTDVALQAARRCAAHLRAGQTFVDLNATSPAIKRAIADVVAPSGADFVEGAILGAINVSGPHTRVLVCGEKGRLAAERLTGLGLNVGFYGPEIGRASTFKLLRSVFSKGIEALLLESLLAARRAGVADDVWREIVETLDERPFAEVGGNWIRTHGRAHARRYHEMVQVKALLDELGIEPLMTRATTAFFERSTRLTLSQAFQDAPRNPDEVVAALDDLVGTADSAARSKGAF